MIRVETTIRRARQVDVLGRRDAERISCRLLFREVLTVY